MNFAYQLLQISSETFLSSKVVQPPSRSRYPFSGEGRSAATPVPSLTSEGFIWNHPNSPPQNDNQDFRWKLNLEWILNKLYRKCKLTICKYCSIDDFIFILIWGADSPEIRRFQMKPPEVPTPNRIKIETDNIEGTIRINISQSLPFHPQTALNLPRVWMPLSI